MEHEEVRGIFATTTEHGNIVTATITIQKPLLKNMYQHVLYHIKSEAHTFGFSRGNTPLTYLDNTHRPAIHEHVKEFFFNYCVYSSLFKELMEKKIILIGEPSLKDIALTSEENINFIFDLPIVRLDIKNEWKKLLFKAPVRKNYKDLDRQVITFAKEEEKTAQTYTPNAIQVHDWVSFTVSLLDTHEQPLLTPYEDTLWLRIGDEEADQEARILFAGKKIGDHFVTTSKLLQRHMSAEFDTSYFFAIKIIQHVPHALFSFEQFKHHFKIKTGKELHAKFIEIFSYRNDLSQRRETVEKLFKTLLNYYPFTIPEHLVARQQRRVLELVHSNPDYQVYKAQNDFKQRIKQLAEKQLQEAIIIDTIAYHENIQVTSEDILGYLNLLKRPRTKEFIHFCLPQTRLNDQEAPIAHEMLRHYCLREKTLNHILYYLTKN